MNSYYLTDPGKVRTHNEDSVLIMTNNNNEVLMIVADGMGGMKSGEKASDVDREEHGSVLQCPVLGVGVCHSGWTDGLDWNR